MQAAPTHQFPAIPSRKKQASPDAEQVLALAQYRLAKRNPETPR